MQHKQHKAPKVRIKQHKKPHFNIWKKKSASLPYIICQVRRIALYRALIQVRGASSNRHRSYIKGETASLHVLERSHN